MPASNLFGYIWNEHIETLFVIPLFPFAVTASLLNGGLQRVSEPSINTVRSVLRVLFTLAIVLCFGAGVLMVLASLAGWQVALAGTTVQHLLAGLGLFWLGAGCHLLRSVASHGNWQI